MSDFHVSPKSGWRLATRELGAVVVGLWAALSGCRGSDSLPAYQVYAVTGKVLLADGRPLGGGWITFVSKGDLPVSPSAEIRSDGTFSLLTGGSGEGAPAGEYKIRVETPQFQRGGQKARHKPLYPARYTDEDSSGLVATVRAEANQLQPILLR
jgi:hypothetical protein